MTTLVACRVRVPCTTSNLGAGFDCLGLALDRYLEASFEPGGNGLRLERGGTLAELDTLEVPAARDRLAAAFTSRLQRVQGAFGVDARPAGAPSVSGMLRVTSSIPIAKGLGSSAAATIAGLVLARAAAGEAVVSSPPAGEDRAAEDEGSVGQRESRTDVDDATPRARQRESRADPFGSRFEAGEVAAEAVAIEGHPDNVGPALLGGLVVAMPASGSTRGDAGNLLLRRLPLSPEIGFAFAAPPAPVDTADARTILPKTVPFAMAARSLPRLAALLYGLAHADPECLRAGFDDELHVRHRLPQIPGGADAFGVAREAGAWAATISGSGSGLIAACPAGAEAGVADAMRESLRRAAGHAIGFPLRPELEGTRLLEP